MATRTEPRGPRMRERVGSAARAAHLDEPGKAWRRLPSRARTLIPAVILLGLAATYPLYLESLPTNIPLILEFPSVSTAVIMIVFVMMAVGLNIVVGYSGLLDLGYVAFYAVGAYTAGWLASGQFQQVKVHILSSGVGPDPKASKRRRHPRGSPLFIGERDGDPRLPQEAVHRHHRVDR